MCTLFQVMWPRTTSSLIRAVFLQFTTLFVFIALQSFNPLHPLTWISTSIGLLITPTSWFYDLIAIVTVTGIGLFYSSQVSLFPWIPKNHLANFTRCFLPQVGTGYFFMKIMQTNFDDPSQKMAHFDPIFAWIVHIFLIDYLKKQHCTIHVNVWTITSQVLA